MKQEIKMLVARQIDIRKPLKNKNLKLHLYLLRPYIEF
jgi:hypothetical protein